MAYRCVLNGAMECDGCMLCRERENKPVNDDFCDDLYEMERDMKYADGTDD